MAIALEHMARSEGMPTAYDDMSKEARVKNAKKVAKAMAKSLDFTSHAQSVYPSATCRVQSNLRRETTLGQRSLCPLWRLSYSQSLSDVYPPSICLQTILCQPLLQ